MVMFPRVLFFATILSSATSLATAQHPAAPTPAAPAHAAEAKKDTYAVVSIDGKLSVMTDAAVEARKKALHDAYDKELAEFNKAKQAADAAKKPFDQKAPKLATITVKKGGFGTEALASAFLIEQEKEHAKPKETPHPKDAAHPKHK